MEWWDILKVSIPVLAVVVGWAFNEHSKRRSEGYNKKEDRYRFLLESMKGFYSSTERNEAKKYKDMFVENLSVAWLYCPDSIIKACCKFLDLVSVGANADDAEKELALAKVVELMRKDLLGHKFWFWKRTKLDASHYRHLRST